MATESAEWTRVETTAVASKFWRAGGRSLHERQVAACPMCNVDSLRVYAHHFDEEGTRSALWVWCNQCHLWTALSNMGLDTPFADPYRHVLGDEFELMERDHWIQRLDELWESGFLPWSGANEGD